jgi:uncharacterized membrane protein YkoI
MKIRTFALTALALSAVAGFALASSTTGRPLKLAEVVAQLESRYPGEVVAIEYDGSGDKRAHYHVDMSFPADGVVSVDVDALTLVIASRDVASLAIGTATLPEVVAMVAGQLPGQVTRAQLDSASGAPLHYDVDVRLQTGGIARMKVDPQSRQIAWRSPAILAD